MGWWLNFPVYCWRICTRTMHAACKRHFIIEVACTCNFCILLWQFDRSKRKTLLAKRVGLARVFPGVQITDYKHLDYAKINQVSTRYAMKFPRQELLKTTCLQALVMFSMALFLPQQCEHKTRNETQRACLLREFYGISQVLVSYQPSQTTLPLDWPSGTMCCTYCAFEVSLVELSPDNRQLSIS